MSMSSSMLRSEVLGSVNHVGQRSLCLLPLTGLETTVRVNPELLWLQVLQHLLNSVLDFLLRWDTRRVDVVDTRSDVSRVSLVNKDLQQLSVGLAVLNGQHIGVEGSNGVEEVLELRVAEVGVDLCTVLDTRSGQTERVNSPLEVVCSLLALAEGQTLSESWLVNLDDVNTSLLKVNNLVSECESELLCLDRLVDIVSWE